MAVVADAARPSAQPDPEPVIAGAAMTAFGRHPDRGPVELAVHAAGEALAEAGVAPGDVDAVYVGTFLAQALQGQGVLASIVATRLGIDGVPTTVVEGACASGGIALRHGMLACRSGAARVALCVGVDHMTAFPTPRVTAALAGALEAGGDRAAGLTFPGFFALVASAYTARHGATDEQLAAVTVKNRAAGAANERAMFRAPVTAGEVTGSRLIADPLRLLHCSPIADGAAAAVVCRPQEASGARRPPVRILACEQASGPTAVADAGSLTSFPATVRAARRAYAAAGISPHDVDVAEVHDCFAIAEIVDCEDLGLFAPGTAAGAIASGATAPGGAACRVNPSGGLLSRGHPVGATGLAQVHELVAQLRGDAAEQVSGARIGLAHNLGGTGATATVTVLAA